ncbi:MAG: hypothetical protein WC530_01840 [Candidatus Omnitrophota bacterium]
MKICSIKAHLQPYSIMKKRQTTINHAFASAIAPSDSYDVKTIKEAVVLLGQDPEKDLLCVYCGAEAETWDHVFGLVRDLQFSGYGHVIGNLLPSCKKCNSEKGNRDWECFLRKKNSNDSGSKIDIIKRYFSKYLPAQVDYEQIKNACPEEMGRLESIKNNVMDLFKEADAIAEQVRERIRSVL